MCVVSAVMDNINTIPLNNWNWPAYTDLQLVLDAVNRLDAKLNQKDCVDPEKAKILKRIEERLPTVEKNTTPVVDRYPQSAYVVYGVIPNVARWNVRVFLNETDAITFAKAAQESNSASIAMPLANKYDSDSPLLPNVATIYFVETLPFGPYNP